MMKSLMKRVTMFLIIIGICTTIAPWKTFGASDELMAAAGFTRFLESRRAPEFDLKNLEGNRVRLKDYRGRIVLLNFWATW